MNLDRANLINLTELWKHYGYQSIHNKHGLSFHLNTHWPKRCWANTDLSLPGSEIEPALIDRQWLDALPDGTIFPVWKENTDNSDANLFEQTLVEANWRCQFQQFAMYMELPEKTVYSTAKNENVEVVQASTPEEIKDWVEISSGAFGYSIDLTAIEKASTNKNIRLLTSKQMEQTAASALLYKTQNIIGLHQLGVKAAFQGQGLATGFMHHLLNMCVQWQGKYIVLQASLAGKPLYDRLGFQTQFVINNYQRI